MFVDIAKTDKKYTIIYADPPWRYSDKKCNGAAEFHYKTMALKDICALPIKNIAAADAVLFLWATYPLLAEALELMGAWGFEYKTIAFQWLKLNSKGKGEFFGLGRWTRGNTEPCLIGVKGKPYKLVQSKGVSQIIKYPVTRHSAKPPVTRDKIVQLMGDVSRIELFARDSAEGWDCWGNEAPTNIPMPHVAAINEQISLFNMERNEEYG